MCLLHPLPFGLLVIVPLPLQTLQIPLNMLTATLEYQTLNVRKGALKSVFRHPGQILMRQVVTDSQ